MLEDIYDGLVEDYLEPFERYLSRESNSSEGRDEDHLEDLKDGAGCTEIWEKLSEDRNGCD